MTLAADLQAQSISTSTSPSPGLEPSSKAISPISPPSPPRSDHDHDSGPTSDDESEPRTPSSDISTMSWPVDSQTGKPLTAEQLARIRAEEPLHLPPYYMAGYFPGEPGMKLKEGRYRIILKIGWMRYSSTWLVEDTEYVQFIFIPVSQIDANISTDPILRNTTPPKSAQYGSQTRTKTASRSSLNACKQSRKMQRRIHVSLSSSTISRSKDHMASICVSLRT